MAPKISKEALVQLETFVNLCKATPSLLHEPSLEFFKEYLESLGAKIPEPPEKTAEEESPHMDEADNSTVEDDTEITEESSEESEVELDNSGVVEPDTIDETVPFGDETIEVTEDMLEESGRLRIDANDAFINGHFEEAVILYGEAIIKNPQSAVLYAKRANVFLSEGKPNSAIRDCDKALSLNPDQALAFKYRGYAHRLLGHWEEAAKDLAVACNLDYSEEANKWLKEVKPNVKKLQEHKRKYERKRMEKKLKERQARYERMKEESASNQSMPNFGGFPNTSDFSKGAAPFMNAGMQELLQDPEVLQAFQDPEVAAAFQDISQNPANFVKHQSNPKIAEILAKITQKFGGKDKANV